MGSGRHRVGSVEVELHSGDADEAQALMQQVSLLRSRQLQPLLDRLFSEASPAAPVHRIERLEVDLGVLPHGGFDQRFLRALESQLKQALPRALAARPQSDEGKPSCWALLELFVWTGNLPWWAATEEGEVVARALEEAMQHGAQELVQRIGAWSAHRAPRARLARLLGAPALDRIADLARSQPALLLAGRLRRECPHLWCANVAGAAAARARAAVLEVLAADLGAGATGAVPLGATPESIAERILRDLAAEPGFEPLAAALHSPPRKRAPGTQGGPVARAESDREQPSLGAKRASAPPDQELPLASPAPQSSPQALRRAPAAPAESSLGAKRASAPPDQELPLPRPAPPSSPQARRRAPAAPAESDREQPSLSTQRADGPPDQELPAARPAPPSNPQALRRAVASLGDLATEHAGLVLLWPFLARLFQRLELLDEDQAFRNEDCEMRAVRLLSHLADAEAEPLEAALALCKLLCGLPPEALYVNDTPLSARELAECETLLQAAIEHAAVLKGMSPETFRSTYLRRTGALVYSGGAWQLRVEGESADVLLERFPWSWRWLRLPWMPHALQVLWP